ncbi:unannotated protein [freshwater metagenome]|uniref:Unannotated protein n=1 Tax=freshwater metagenome TaxID=449393 RepID=A0A6J6BPC2_9ZZZZ
MGIVLNRHLHRMAHFTEDRCGGRVGCIAAIDVVFNDRPSTKVHPVVGLMTLGVVGVSCMSHIGREHE